MAGDSLVTNIMQQVPEDDPLMIAYKKYTSTDEYKNTQHWAQFKEHLEGSLWAAFMAGFRARQQEEPTALELGAAVRAQGLTDDG